MKRFTRLDQAVDVLNRHYKIQAGDHGRYDALNIIKGKCRSFTTRPSGKEAEEILTLYISLLGNNKPMAEQIAYAICDVTQDRWLKLLECDFHRHPDFFLKYMMDFFIWTSLLDELDRAGPAAE